MPKHKNKELFENALEIVLRETPDILSPFIKTIVSEYSYEGLHYWLKEETKTSSSSYRKILIGIMHGDDETKSIIKEDCIGILTLQSLGSGKAILRVPPRSKWHINIEPETLYFLAEEDLSHISNDKFNWYYNDSYFTRLLEALFTEFQRLGFIDFKDAKPPIGFRTPRKEKE